MQSVCSKPPPPAPNGKHFRRKFGAALNLGGYGQQHPSSFEPVEGGENRLEFGFCCEMGEGTTKKSVYKCLCFFFRSGQPSGMGGNHRTSHQGAHVRQPDDRRVRLGSTGGKSVLERGYFGWGSTNPRSIDSSTSRST